MLGLNDPVIAKREEIPVVAKMQILPGHAKGDGAYVLWVSETEGFEVSCDLRYINHSDRPNACYYDDLSVVALCDIQPGEEITHDYGCVDW